MTEVLEHAILSGRCPHCGWTRPDGEGLHPLTEVRAMAGWSYQTLARLIARQARVHGVLNMAAERQKVWRWERRGVMPDRQTQQYLAEILEIPPAVVRASGWPAWLREAPVLRLDDATGGTQ